MPGLTEHVGDFFKVPEGSVLIHSCNCQGEWGSGVAAAFRQKFPVACAIYEDFCLTPDTTHHKKWLLGTTLLIPPQEEDVEKSGSYWIACLMTSLNYGKKKDKPDAILEYTRKAMENLKVKIKEKERQIEGLSLFDKLYTIRINSAAFNVPWPKSRAVLRLSLLDIRVINNVEVLSKKNRQEVLEDMEANGFDTTEVKDFAQLDQPKEEQTIEEAQPEPKKMKSSTKKRKSKTDKDEDRAEQNAEDVGGTDGSRDLEGQKKRKKSRSSKEGKDKKEKKAKTLKT